MNPVFVIAAAVVCGVFVVYCLIDFWEGMNEASSTAAKNAKLDLLKATPITEQQAEELRAERDRIKWETIRDRILTMSFGICLVVVVTVVEFDRPKPPLRETVTGRQQVAIGALGAFYLVVTYLMARERGKVSAVRFLTGMIGRSPATDRNRIEEIEAQLSAPRN